MFNKRKMMIPGSNSSNLDSLPYPYRDGYPWGKPEAGLTIDFKFNGLESVAFPEMNDTLCFVRGLLGFAHALEYPTYTKENLIVKISLYLFRMYSFYTVEDIINNSTILQLLDEWDSLTYKDRMQKRITYKINEVGSMHTLPLIGLFHYSYSNVSYDMTFSMEDLRINTAVESINEYTPLLDNVHYRVHLKSPSNFEAHFEKVAQILEALKDKIYGTNANLYTKIDKNHISSLMYVSFNLNEIVREPIKQELIEYLSSNITNDDIRDIVVFPLLCSYITDLHITSTDKTVRVAIDTSKLSRTVNVSLTGKIRGVEKYDNLDIAERPYYESRVFVNNDTLNIDTSNANYVPTKFARFNFNNNNKVNILGIHELELNRSLSLKERAIQSRYKLSPYSVVPTFRPINYEDIGSNYAVKISDDLAIYKGLDDLLLMTKGNNSSLGSDYGIKKVLQHAIDKLSFIRFNKDNINKLVSKALDPVYFRNGLNSVILGSDIETVEVNITVRDYNNFVYNLLKLFTKDGGVINNDSFYEFEYTDSIIPLIIDIFKNLRSDYSNLFYYTISNYYLMESLNDLLIDMDDSFLSFIKDSPESKIYAICGAILNSTNHASLYLSKVLSENKTNPAVIELVITEENTPNDVFRLKLERPVTVYPWISAEELITSREYIRYVPFNQYINNLDNGNDYLIPDNYAIPKTRIKAVNSKDNFYQLQLPFGRVPQFTNVVDSLPKLETTLAGTNRKVLIPNVIENEKINITNLNYYYSSIISKDYFHSFIDVLNTSNSSTVRNNLDKSFHDWSDMIFKEWSNMIFNRRLGLGIHDGLGFTTKIDLFKNTNYRKLVEIKDYCQFPLAVKPLKGSQFCKLDYFYNTYPIKHIAIQLTEFMTDFIDDYNVKYHRVDLVDETKRKYFSYGYNDISDNSIIEIINYAISSLLNHKGNDTGIDNFYSNNLANRRHDDYYNELDENTKSNSINQLNDFIMFNQYTSSIVFIVPNATTIKGDNTTTLCDVVQYTNTDGETNVKTLDFNLQYLFSFTEDDDLIQIPKETFFNNESTTGKYKSDLATVVFCKEKDYQRVMNIINTIKDPINRNRELHNLSLEDVISLDAFTNSFYAIQNPEFGLFGVRITDTGIAKNHLNSKLVDKLTEKYITKDRSDALVVRNVNYAYNKAKSLSEQDEYVITLETDGTYNRNDYIPFTYKAVLYSNTGTKVKEVTVDQYDGSFSPLDEFNSVLNLGGLVDLHEGDGKVYVNVATADNTYSKLAVTKFQGDKVLYIKQIDLTDLGNVIEEPLVASDEIFRTDFRIDVSNPNSLELSNKTLKVDTILLLPRFRYMDVYRYHGEVRYPSIIGYIPNLYLESALDGELLKDSLKDNQSLSLNDRIKITVQHFDRNGIEFKPESGYLVRSSNYNRPPYYKQLEVSIDEKYFGNFYTVITIEDTEGIYNHTYRFEDMLDRSMMNWGTTMTFPVVNTVVDNTTVAIKSTTNQNNPLRSTTEINTTVYAYYYYFNTNIRNRECNPNEIFKVSAGITTTGSFNSFNTTREPTLNGMTDVALTSGGKALSLGVNIPADTNSSNYSLLIDFAGTRRDKLQANNPSDSDYFTTQTVYRVLREQSLFTEVHLTDTLIPSSYIDSGIDRGAITLDLTSGYGFRAPAVYFKLSYSNRTTSYVVIKITASLSEFFPDEALYKPNFFHKKTGAQGDKIIIAVVSGETSTTPVIDLVNLAVTNTDATNYQGDEITFTLTDAVTDPHLYIKYYDEVGNVLELRRPLNINMTETRYFGDYFNNVKERAAKHGFYLPNPSQW